MKNKSKLQKIRKGNPKVPAVPAEWLYLIPEEVKLRQIYEVFSGDESWKAEFWEEAGVLEVEFPEAGSLDMEEMDCDLGEEAGNAWLAEHRIQTAFAVTIRPEDYGTAQQVMKKIVETIGGFFCGDTEDFSPVIGCPEK